MNGWSNPIPRDYGGGNLHSVSTFTCFKVEVLNGDGSPESPIRVVTYYFDETGALVAGGIEHSVEKV